MSEEYLEKIVTVFVNTVTSERLKKLKALVVHTVYQTRLVVKDAVKEFLKHRVHLNRRL